MGIDLILVSVVVFVGGGATAFVAYKHYFHKVKTLPTAIAHVSEHFTVVSTMDEQVNQLAKLSASIGGDSEMAITVGELALAAKRIVGELKRDPSDLETLRPFFEYHLPKSIELVKEYMVVAKQPSFDDTEDALESARATLVECRVNFNAFFKKSLGNDVAGLEIKSDAVKRIGRVERPH